jgi:hypothetical protein
MLGNIPKRIIQTGKTRDQSLTTRAVMSNLRLLNPDFEYLFFDNEDVESFIQTSFPQYREVFDGFRFAIQKYDFFRYLVIYRHGGFYFDLDVLLAEGLSGLLDSSCVFPFEGLTFSHFLKQHLHMDWMIGNYAFGAVAGHPFLAAIIENCVKATKDPSWVSPMMAGSIPLVKKEFFVLNSTGPGLISRTLAENPEAGSAVTILFPDDVCDVRQWNHFGDLGVHLMDGSWRIKSGFVRRKLAQYWEHFKVEALLKDSRKLGAKRAHVGTTRVCAGSHP